MSSRRRHIIPFLLALSLVAGAVPAVQAQGATGPAMCRGGEAAGYPCKGIDLLSFLPSSEMNGARIADVWGWVDPETDKEYALLGSTRGVLFIDVSKPEKPVFLGSLAGKAESVLIWQELDVVNDHAYIVCDLSPCNLQIFDLTRLRGAESAQRWTPDSVFPIPNAHSIDSNPDTGHIFVNGSLALGGAPVILDVSDPLTPRPVGLMADDGYTHDSLCRTYKGPDKPHRGNEICFNFNEDTVTIYDVTSDPMTPEQLARETYENASYTHSGALTKDHSYLISTDEGDETSLGLRSTLYIWDVRKLSAPKLIGTYVAKSGAIDHNVYSESNALFHANYTNGFRILDLKHAARAKLKEVAYFDIMPAEDGPQFDGVWAAYPYLPSGNVLVGGMGQGLFIVRPDPAVLKKLGVKR